MNQEQKIQFESNQKTKKTNQTVLILCLLLFVTCCSTIFLASNSVTTAGPKITPTANTPELPNFSDQDVKDITTFVTELQKELNKLDLNLSVDELKLDIVEILNKLQTLEIDSGILNGLTKVVLEVLAGTYDTGEELVNGVVSTVIPFIANAGKLLDIVLDYDEKVEITSTTAAKEAGTRFQEKLTAYIYYAEEKSNKWAVLVHPFMLSGEIYASSVAKMYLNKGYNVIAPDLRGFGASKGSVAMGYLESLDIWDWLTYINNSSNKGIGDKAAKQVIIHGTSLGGATTLQTWTQVSFGRDLTKQNVIGIVDDCGYASMTGIIEGMLTSTPGIDLINSLIELTGNGNLYQIVGDENVKTILMTMLKIGLTEENFDVKQDTFHSSRKISNVPLFVIHGNADTTVPFSISKDIVVKKAKDAGLLYKFWEVPGQPHAFVILGMKNTEYTKEIHSFIDYAEKNKPNSEGKNEGKEEEKTSESKPQKENEKTEQKEEKGFFESIGEGIADFFQSIWDFLKGLFE